MTPRISVILAIRGAVHNIVNGGNRHRSADHSQLSRGAGFRTFPAARAVLRGIQSLALRRPDMHNRRTRRNAGPAGCAQLRLRHDQRLAVLAFRVRTPPAAQGAPLEEHQRPHPVAVMGVALLDIENTDFSAHHVVLVFSPGAVPLATAEPLPLSAKNSESATKL